MKDSTKKKWNDLLGHLKKLAPTLLGAAGTVAGGPAVGSLAYTLARAVTKSPDGTDPDDLATAVFGDPSAMIELERITLERERMNLEAKKAESEAETARLQTVNETMRSEASADDPWTRRWRPAWGFISAAAFFLQVSAIAYLMFAGDPTSAVLITSIGSLSVFWSVPLAILGISAWTRGQEKMLRAGKN